MNGEALTKRYEVRDAQTGEEVEGAFVLRPNEDDAAYTAMFCYGHLLGLDARLMRALMEAVKEPYGDTEAVLREVAAERADVPEDCESMPFDWFLDLATLGAGDGSLERVLTVAERAGLEPVFVAYRVHRDEERMQEALRKILAQDEATERRERTAGQPGGRIEGPDLRAIFRAA